MKIDQPIVEGRFVKRYKRFFVDVELDSGEIVTAHTPNTGSMKSCLKEGAPVRMTFTDDPKRKLKYGMYMIKPGKSWVGVHTGYPNKIALEAFEKGTMKHWAKYKCAKPEVKINDKSRLDLVLWKDDSEFNPKKKIDPSVFSDGDHKFHFVEIKNVTMKEDDFALFPDGVTTRGQKHLEELMHLIDLGHTAEILFTIQRADVKKFAPAKEIDPKYAELLKQAKKKGVIISPYVCDLKKDSVVLTDKNKLPLIL